MSKIGKNPVAVPENVTIDIQGQDVKVKGPKGELAMQVHSDVSAVMEDAEGSKVVRLVAEIDQQALAAAVADHAHACQQHGCRRQRGLYKSSRASRRWLQGKFAGQYAGFAAGLFA